MRQKLLLVRNDDLVRTILVRALRSLGFEVCVYLPGTSAWVLAAEQPIAVIYHVLYGDETEAVTFARKAQEFPSGAKLLFHGECAEYAHRQELLGYGVEFFSSMAPISALLDRLVSLQRYEVQASVA